MLFGRFEEWFCNSISEYIHPTFRYLKKQFQAEKDFTSFQRSLQIIKNSFAPMLAFAPSHYNARSES